MQQRLNQLGIHPGDTITLSARGAFHGPLLVVVHGMRVALGRGVARRVQVELLEHGCPATLGRRGRHRHAHR